MRRFVAIFAALSVLVIGTEAPARPVRVDPTFGYASADFGAQDYVAGTATRSDGKVVVAGSTERGEDSDFAVARFTKRGSLDRSFSKDGRATISFLGLDVAFAVATAPGKKTVVAGFTDDRDTSLGEFAIARLRNDGSLDKSFGKNGKAVIDVSGLIDLATTMIVEPDGKIIAAGFTAAATADAVPGHEAYAAGEIVRLLPNGLLDPTFGVGGRVLVKVDGGIDMIFSLARQKDGAILVSGYTEADDNAPGRVFVNRFLPTGAPDPTFGRAGSVSLALRGSAIPGWGGLAVAGDGSIIAVGSTTDAFGIFRLKPDGTLDRRFNRDGFVRHHPRGRASAAAVAVQRDGKVLVGGFSDVCSFGFCYPSATVIRFTKKGSLDRGFGSAGVIAHLAMNFVQGLVVTRNGFLVAGSGPGSHVSNDGLDFRAIKFLS